MNLVEKVNKNIRNLYLVSKLSKINFEKREKNKGMVYNKLVQKSFFTKGNGVWAYHDIDFPYHIQFSHWDSINSVRIYSAKRCDFWEFKYREYQWINRFLNEVDKLVLDFRGENEK